MRKWTMLFLLAGALLMSGCLDGKQKEAGDREQDVRQENKKYSYTFPLTGKRTNEPPTRRAAAVVINNHPQARPQTGLAAADIVYEVPVEGNITRFLAIYQSEQPETVGPVRSARDYFIDLTKGYNGLFIAHGYSPEARERLLSGEIDELNGIQYDGKVFKRDPSRKAPHNSYVDFDKMYKKAEERGYSIEGMPDRLHFLNTITDAGQKAAAIHVNYSSQPAFQAEYKYSPSKKRYERFVGGEQQLDRETKEPLSASNVFIIEADQRVMDSEGRLEIDLFSGGNAYLLQNGAVHNVEWSNVDGRILPFKEGTLVGFVKGKTWINIIPASQGLSKMVVLENN
ncbi:DUF3048 domain-containing protein [Bacillus sp. B190/17]|uniref:DUF3048 domain-containing protein n=1 Tax=Bacillus lumedeiriae TaxID=3058829 RepID=A0ABW8IBM1_9BACI